MAGISAIIILQIKKPRHTRNSEALEESRSVVNFISLPTLAFSLGIALQAQSVQHQKVNSDSLREEVCV